MALSTFYSSIEKGNITYFSKGFKILNIIFIFLKKSTSITQIILFYSYPNVSFFHAMPIDKNYEHSRAIT
jgi:hypothetical protein